MARQKTNPDSQNSNLMPLTKYAESRNITHSAVQKAIASGRIADAVKGKKGRSVLIDPVLADKLWQENTLNMHKDNVVDKISKASKENVSSLDSQSDDQNVSDNLSKTDQKKIAENYQKSRALREIYQAKMAQLEFEEKSKVLVRVEDVKMHAFNTARVVRDSILAIPDRIAPILANCQDEFECHRIVKEELQRCLEELAGIVQFLD